MTGEISLRGRVMPIGGLREKSMAAYTRHMSTVLIPEDNRSDLQDVDAVVRDSVEFIPAKHLDAVIEHALVRHPSTAIK